MDNRGNSSFTGNLYIDMIQVKKVPEHFPYAIIADNFELFMSEPVCIKLFHDFLIYYDKRHTLITE